MRAASLLLAALVLGGVVAAAAQGPSSVDTPRFEAVSIKPSPPRLSPNSMTTLGANVFRATNAPVLVLVSGAYPEYGLGDRIVGGPDWARTERFDIVATAAGAPTRDQYAALQRQLLADRFKLVVRREQREMPVLVLSLARSDGQPGAQLKRVEFDCTAYREAFARAQAPPDAATRAPGSAPTCSTLSAAGAAGRKISGKAVALPELARALTSSAGALVVDRTNLTGVYDFEVSFVSDQALQAPGGTAGEGVSLATALREQLGLKLERQRVPVDVLVIESVERPTPD